MLNNQIGQMQDKNLYIWTTEDEASDVGSQSEFATKLRKNGLGLGGTAEDEHTQPNSPESTPGRLLVYFKWE